MIFVDAREGVSGDMLLAAMIGLMDGEARTAMVEDTSRAARAIGVEFHLIDIAEDDEAGFAISYTSKATEGAGRSREEAVEALRRMHGPGDPLGPHALDVDILDTLFRAEAEAHAVSVDQVHLHEVGRGGALVNMYGIGKAHSTLREAGAGDFICSTITTGKGIVVIAHGAVRVPAPACAHLLKGLKHEAGAEPGERATPTGIAAIKVLARVQSDEIPSRFAKRSIGYGTRRFAGRLGRTILYWT